MTSLLALNWGMLGSKTTYRAPLPGRVLSRGASEAGKQSLKHALFVTSCSKQPSPSSKLNKDDQFKYLYWRVYHLFNPLTVKNGLQALYVSKSSCLNLYSKGLQSSFKLKVNLQRENEVSITWTRKLVHVVSGYIKNLATILSKKFF